uniref:POM121 transmembrane nucleoporin like 2 n=1 Tax=Oryctolagus cuniculus TaxID=9986 RepID=G1SJJ5_RABIT
MGNDLGLSGPPQPVPSQEGKDQQETPDRHPPGRAPLPTPPGHQVPRHDPSPGCQPSGRPAQRRGQTPFSGFGIAPRRRYPIQQPRYSRVGCLPTVCWNGSPKKPVLSVGNSKTVCRSGTVRVPPLDRRLTRRPGPGLSISSTLPSQSAKAQDPCAPQSGATALPERKRRRSPAGEAQILLAGPETKGGCPAGPGQGQPAVWAPLTGPQDSDAHLSKRPRHSSESSPERSTTAGIPVPVRNAISSSYSSTGGLLRPRKRGWPTSSAFRGPAASCSKIPERPAKVSGEEALGPRSSTSPPLVTDRESQRRRAVCAAAEKPGLRNSPPTPGGSWPHKRKFPEQLSGGGDLGTLPPAPRLGYPVTLGDGDMATKGSSRWLNKPLEHRMDAAQESAPGSPPRTQPPSALPLPAASTAPSSAAFWGPIKRQTARRFPAFPEYAGVAATVAPSPAKIARLMGPVDSSRPQRLPANSVGLKPAAPCAGLITAPVMMASDNKSPPALQAETSAQVTMPQGPLPTSSPPMLLDKPRTPPPDAVCPGGAAPENLTAPMLKAMCTTTSGSESAGPLPSGPILTTPTSSSSTMVTTTCTSTLNLKPAPVRLAKHVKQTTISTTTPASTATTTIQAPASSRRAPASTAAASTSWAPASTAAASTSWAPASTAPASTSWAPASTAPASTSWAPASTAPASTSWAPASTAAAFTNWAPASTAAASTNRAPASTAAAFTNWAPASTAAASTNRAPASTAAASTSRAPAPTAAASSHQTPASTSRALEALSSGVCGAADNDLLTMFEAMCVTAPGNKRKGPLPSGPILTPPTSSSSNTMWMTTLKSAPVRLAKHIKRTNGATMTPASTAPALSSWALASTAPASTAAASTRRAPAATAAASTSRAPAATAAASTSRAPASTAAVSTSRAPASTAAVSTSRAPASTAAVSTSRAPAPTLPASTSRAPATTAAASTSRAPATTAAASTSRAPAPTLPASNSRAAASTAPALSSQVLASRAAASATTTSTSKDSFWLWCQRYDQRPEKKTHF